MVATTVAPAVTAPPREKAPETVTPSAPRRVGALDGLRAVAVIAVIVYHLSPRRLPSGFLGVDVFMVVSGYLITSLLLSERDRTGRIALARFWGRRFRRLVPALMVVVAVVAIFVHIEGPRVLVPSVRSQGAWAIFYASNWKLVFDSVSYGGAVGAHSPLVHLWSLAVEEQFYLVWPAVLVMSALLLRGRRRGACAIAIAGVVASAAAMALHYRSGQDPSRLYYGTDTRAQTFLIGALAAFAAPYLVGRAGSFVRRAGLPALVVTLIVMRTDAPGVLYRGGFAIVAVVAGIVVLATTMASPVARALDLAPLRGVGRISYGIYLWHWPAIALLTADRMHMSGARLVTLQLAVTAAGALLSWFLLERPLARSHPRTVALTGAATIGVAVLALATLPSANVLAYADVQTERPPAPRVVEPVLAPTGHTAMIVGDSGMYDTEPALAAGLSRAGWRVVEMAFPGAGLTRPAGVREVWANVARTYHVDLTIVMLGRWDADWIQEHGDGAYRTIVDDAVAKLSSSGGRLLWMSELPGGLESAPVVNPFYRALPSRDRGVVDYVDIAAALRAPNGGYPRRVHGALLRKPDEWHLCPAGAAAVTHTVLRHLHLDRPGWDAGAWRANARYDDPHGGCPPS